MAAELAVATAQGVGADDAVNVGSEQGRLLQVLLAISEAHIMADELGTYASVAADGVGAR